MTAEPVIEVRGLTVSAGSDVLVDDAHLDVLPDAVTALVGPSGSGKTTTALALLGESAPGVQLSGSVRVVGTDVVTDQGPTAAAAGLLGATVAYMPQHPAATLNPARRIGPVLGELARLHASVPAPGDGTVAETKGRCERREAAHAGAASALRRAQLPTDRGTLRRFPHQFSGGQRQRVALAQVLACGPRILVLDEPGTGLDPATRLAVAAHLAELAEQGVAVLLLSHDQTLVRRLAQHAVRLEHGRVVTAGRPDEVLPRVPVRLGPPPATPATPVMIDASDGVRSDAPGPEPVREPGREGEREPGREPGPGLGPEGERPTLLQTRALDAWHRPRHRDQALHAVDLTLGRGECLGVAGRSGSGKTTLARCISGLHERQAGSVLLDGRPLPALRDRSDEQRRRVQYVWQEVRGSFDERRTVLEQVARTAVRLRGRSRATAAQEATDVLDRLGVSTTTADRPPAGLSGGELQRAALARALLAEPDVLLCDEITSSLDGEATHTVTAEVARLRREHGTAVLWIGHDLPLLCSVADRVAVLDDGRVTEQGPTADVLAAPQAEPTRLLLAASRTTPAGPAGERPGRETHTEGVT